MAYVLKDDRVLLNNKNKYRKDLLLISEEYAIYVVSVGNWV